jgi:hypothetical protein
MFRNIHRNFVYFLLHLSTLPLFQTIWQRSFFNPEDGNSTRLRKVDVNLQNSKNNLFVAHQTDSSFEKLPLVNVKQCDLTRLKVRRLGFAQTVLRFFKQNLIFSCLPLIRDVN